MKYLDLTLPSPEENLACDEALLHFCENHEEEPGALRFWESPNHFIVLGYSNKLNAEVHVEKCKTRGVPVLRRFSGGGTVVQGPGCLNYALVMANHQLGDTLDIIASFHFVLERHRDAVARLLGQEVQIAGISDLAVDGVKFSGNAQYRSRNFTLFHGTFLLGFDVALIEALLPMPSRQPHYRRARGHKDFVRNIPLGRHELCAALKHAWQALAPAERFNPSTVGQYVKQRYGRAEWIGKF
ncbi:MAG: lipoate--protein ligase family protein [Deltaproteobacteria bacterium]|nr:lipoate--protein ligase family protein [Deltaproteobacteria bacterium]